MTLRQLRPQVRLRRPERLRMTRRQLQNNLQKGPPEKQARVEETEDEAVKTKLMWQKAHGDNRIALFAWTGSKDKSQILEFTYNGKEMHRDELLQKYRSLVSPYFKKRKGLVKHWPKHELNDLREMLRQARDAS